MKFSGLLFMEHPVCISLSLCDTSEIYNN